MTHPPCRRGIRTLGVASNLGVPGAGCDGGPAALFAAGLSQRIGGEPPRFLRPRPSTDGPEPDRAADALTDLCRRLATETRAALGAHTQPWVIGGDHSIAVGTWRGIATALGHPPGLIWIDAHLDAHTPSTSPSGNRHGMPLATLLGIDGEAPVLDPRRLAVLGARSWETPEREQLEIRGVRIITMSEIADRGISACLADALAITAGGDFGISIDLDALDPGLAPGVTCPVAGGIDPAGLEASLIGLATRETCRAVEIVEYDPIADRKRAPGNLTLRATLAIAAALVANRGHEFRDPGSTRLGDSVAR